MIVATWSAADVVIRICQVLMSLQRIFLRCLHTVRTKSRFGSVTPQSQSMHYCIALMQQSTAAGTVRRSTQPEPLTAIGPENAVVSPSTLGMEKNRPLLEGFSACCQSPGPSRTRRLPHPVLAPTGTSHLAGARETVDARLPHSAEVTTLACALLDHERDARGGMDV
jgi:hypothetical protein